MGFESRARRSWIRSTKLPIREEVGLGALKGYSFSPGWAVSLDFVPHVTSTGRVKQHRTDKQFRADLGVDPLDESGSWDVRDRLATILGREITGPGRSWC